MGLESPLLYMDVDPLVWMAGAWAVLNLMEALHRERPDLTPQELIEITRRDVRFIVGPLSDTYSSPRNSGPG